MNDNPTAESKDSLESGGNQNDSTRVTKAEGVGTKQSKTVFQKAAGALSIVSGYRYAKRNIVITKERASMPMARKIVKDELEWQKISVDPGAIRTELLKKTVFWQQWIFFFSLLTGTWGVLMLIKGWYWLDQTGFLSSTILPGLAISILSISRLFTGYFVIRNCNREIEKRNRVNGVAK
tara:strand:- start:7374 stop:7910 length:537 start_codon:yes stop_codon:yes gene_type:complete